MKDYLLMLFRNGVSLAVFAGMFGSNPCLPLAVPLVAQLIVYVWMYWQTLKVAALKGGAK